MISTRIAHRKLKHNPALSGFKRALLFLCLLLAMTGFNTAAADSKNVKSLHEVKPDSTVGEGAKSLRLVIRDPVTDELWVNKRYRVIVYRHNSSTPIMDVNGVTDEHGNTAHLRVPQNIESADIMASPVVGYGAYEASSQLVTPSGKPAKHHGYVMYLSNGGIFIGRTDEQGNTAIVRQPEQGGLDLKIRSLARNGRWQKQAMILNTTVEARNAEERLSVYEKLLHDKEWGQHDDRSAIPAEALAGSMLTAALRTSPERFRRAAQQYVDIKTAASATGNADNDGRGEKNRFAAYLDLVDHLLARPGVSSKFIDTAVADAAASISGPDSPAARRPVKSRILNMCERLIAYDHADAAIELFEAAGLLDGMHPSDSDNARIFALGALAATVQGDPSRSRRLMSYANVIAASTRDPKQPDDKDELQFFRKDVPAPARGMMYVNTDDLASVRELCIKAGPKQVPALEIVSREDTQNALIAKLQREKGLDALLSHGEMTPGRYKVKLTGCAMDEDVVTLDIDQQIIDDIRRAHVLFDRVIYFGDKNKAPRAPARAATGHGSIPTALQVMAFLQHAKAPPGKYQINKLILPEWFEISLF